MIPTRDEAGNVIMKHIDNMYVAPMPDFTIKSNETEAERIARQREILKMNKDVNLGVITGAGRSEVRAIAGTFGNRYVKRT
jgi:hypothetical protein